MSDISRHSLWSDGSSFYGNEDQKSELKERLHAIDPASWFANKPVTLMEIAANNEISQLSQEKSVLYNQYEGIFCGRQLTETVDEFLKRLPPATTDISALIPWIYIHNPYLSAPCKGHEEESEDDERFDEGEDIKMDDDGPVRERSRDDRARFRIMGENLLSEFQTTIFMLRKEMEGSPPGALYASIGKAREELVQRIKEYAVEYNCVSGKWLLFKDSFAVNEVWSLIAHKTATNELGTDAKVAPSFFITTPLELKKLNPEHYSRNPAQTDSRNPRVICVYTKDFNDLEDVIRVLRKLKDIGLCDITRPIYYKCDAYTYLDLKAGNEWGIKPSLYSSTELLKPKNGNLDFYFK